MNIEGSGTESVQDSTASIFEYNLIERIEKDLENLSNLLEKSSDKEKFQNSHLQEVANKLEELQKENIELKNERELMMNLLEELTDKLTEQIKVSAIMKKTHNEELLNLQSQHMDLMKEMTAKLSDSALESMNLKLKITNVTQENEKLKREKQIHLKAIKELAEHQSQINNKILDIYNESVELHKDFSVFELKKKLEKAEEERKLLEKMYIEQTGNKNIMRDIRKQANNIIASKEVQQAQKIKKNKKSKVIKKLEEINQELECNLPRKTRGRKPANKRDESNKENLGEMPEQRLNNRKRSKMEEEDSREEEEEEHQASQSSDDENEHDSDFMKEEIEEEQSQTNSSEDEAKKKGGRRKKINQSSNEKQTTQGKGKNEVRKPKKERSKNLKEISMMAMNSIQHDLFST